MGRKYYELLSIDSVDTLRSRMVFKRESSDDSYSMHLEYGLSENIYLDAGFFGALGAMSHQFHSSVLHIKNQFDQPPSITCEVPVVKADSSLAR